MLDQLFLISHSPPIKTFMPAIQRQTYNTRILLHYKPFPFYNKQFSLIFYPYFTKKWNSSHKTFERDLIEYKVKLKNIYKAPKYKFYYRGSNKKGCSLITQLRISLLAYPPHHNVFVMRPGNLLGTFSLYVLCILENV